MRVKCVSVSRSCPRPTGGGTVRPSPLSITLLDLSPWRPLQNIAPSLPTLSVPGEAAGSRVVTTRSTSPDAFPAASPASEAVRDGEIDGERSLPRLRRFGLASPAAARAVACVRASHVVYSGQS